MSKPVILCVDDERIILSSLKTQLHNHLSGKFQIELAESGEEALEIIRELSDKRIEIPLIIADQIMGGMYGDELLALVKQLLPNTHSIMLTGQASAESVGEAVNKAQLFRYISKPWQEQDLILTVKTALESYQRQMNLCRQDSYQNALNRILQLALEPNPIEEQLSDVLSATLATLCFSDTNKGSIFVEAPNQSDIGGSKLVIITDQNNEEGSGHFAEDIREACTDVVLVNDTSTPNFSLQSILPRYYRAPIMLREEIIGFLYLYVSNFHTKSSQTEAFVRSVSHTIAGIIRMSQYNLALEQHNTKLEDQVKMRTRELNEALTKQANNNNLLIETNKKLEYFATTDELTGLFNRRCFIEHADNEAYRAHRYKRSTVLAMLDLDFFKEVNDNYGHQIGDIVLARIAKVLFDNIREHDIVGRIGGEEFAIVMPETNIQGGIDLCERICKAISNTLMTFESFEIRVSASIGVTEILEEELSISSAMIRADHALYDSKHKGRNQISQNMGA